MQQEDLARLFSAQLNLSQAQTPAVQAQESTDFAPAEAEGPNKETEQKPAPVIYASQHYTHTYHLAPSRQRNETQTQTQTQLDTSEIVAVLLRNSIDPSLLFPSQVDLFQQADDDQRLRLLELWRISPPQGRQGYPEGVDYNKSRQLYDWPPASLAQEEAMARLRYESMLQDQSQQENTRLRHESMLQDQMQRENISRHQEELDSSMDDESGPAVAEPIRIAASPERTAEPYITTGYDMLAQREYAATAQADSSALQESTRYNQATDPVYNGGLWQKDTRGILDMENQYGAFAHARDYDVRPIFVDDDMVM